MFKHTVLRFLSRPGFRGELTITMDGETRVVGGPAEPGEGVFVAKAFMRVTSPAFFRRFVLFGQSGFGKSYFMGEFETDDLRSLLHWFAQNAHLLPGMDGNKSAEGIVNRGAGLLRLAHRLRKNTRAGSRRNIRAHYDLSNTFYELWLDPSMTYSSGIFTPETGEDLEVAQKEKYRRICEKLSLGPDDHVLEIGCGWGGFAEFAARNCGCRLTVTTISDAQYAYAEKRFKDTGLSDRITLLRKDYRDLEGTYDNIVSIEMMEAIGHEHVPVFVKKCAALLRDGGAACLQIITVPDEHFENYLATSDYIRDYIFPGSELLSIGQVVNAAKDVGFRKEHQESIGHSYATTLRLWAERFMAQKDAVAKLGFDERFRRMWCYYLICCEVAFATDYIDDVQVVLRKS